MTQWSRRLKPTADYTATFRGISPGTTASPSGPSCSAAPSSPATGAAGTPGRIRLDPHPDAGAAVNALARLARTKRRRGYQNRAP